LPENKLKELKLVKKKFRVVSMLLTVVLLMSAFVTPVAAGQGNSRGQERGQGRQGEQIQYLDAEVRVIDGQSPDHRFRGTSEKMSISPDKIFWDEKNDPYAVRIEWALDEVEEQSSTYISW